MINKIKYSLSLLVSILFTIIILKFITDGGWHLALLPFLICGISMIFLNIYSILGNEKARNYFYKVYLITFLIYWFASISYVTYVIIKAQEYLMLLMIIPFWAASIFAIKCLLLNKKLEEKK